MSTQQRALAVPRLGKAAIMRTVSLTGVGVLVALAGIIFTLQGVGVIGAGAMSGVTFWGVAGPVIAVAGLAIAGLALRRHRTA